MALVGILSTQILLHRFMKQPGITNLRDRTQFGVQTR